MFFGRRQELEEVIRILRGHFQDRVTVIHGRRRVGKTSLLFQLKQGNPELLGIPILQEIQHLYVPVLLSFERVTAENKTWEVYYYIYRNIQQELDLAGIQSLSISMTDFRDLSADALLENFILDVIRQLRANNQKLLLMSDEFDNLIRIKGEERGLFGFIRELIVRHGEHISFIFVGADELVGMMKTRANRLYSMAGTPLEIQDLTPEEAGLLITEPMRKVNPKFEWADGAIRLVIALTVGNPYYIQTICDRVINNLVAGKRLRATTLDVEQAVKETLEHIGDLADILSNSNLEEKVVLSCMADIAHYEAKGRNWVTSSNIEQKICDLSSTFPVKQIPAICRSLQMRYIVGQRAESDLELEYSIRVPLLRIHIQNTLKLRDTLREGGYL